MGIIVDNVEYICKKQDIDFNMHCAIFQFFTYKEGVQQPQTQSIVLTGTQFRNFYDNWTMHRQVYKLLCDELNLDYSVIPEDIEEEI